MDSLIWLKRLALDGRKLRGWEIRALRLRLNQWPCIFAWRFGFSWNEWKRIEAGRRPLAAHQEFQVREWAIRQFTRTLPIPTVWLDRLEQLELIPVWVAAPTEAQVEAQEWAEQAQA